MSAAKNLHASVVAFGPAGGVLIRGPSGSGKSQLALALIGLGAELVADDQVFLTASAGALYARPPRAIAGLIESRGVGLLRMVHRRLARIALVVDMGLPRGPRLPQPQLREINAIPLPCFPGSTDISFALGLRGVVRAHATLRTGI